MPETRDATIGVVDANELMPKGRVVYEAVREYITDKPTEFHVVDKSPAALLLDRVCAEHATMDPPLPEEVVETIGAFARQYKDYISGDGYAYLGLKRRNMEAVANKLVSVVFEYGYANLLSVTE